MTQVKFPNKDKLKSYDQRRNVRIMKEQSSEKTLYGQIFEIKSDASQQPKGELVGPGKFVNQDTLVANAQGSSSLNYYWPSRHEGFSTT